MSTQQQLEQAIDLQRNNDLEGAEAAYKALLEAEPENHELLHLLGLCRQQGGDLDGAQQWFAKAIEASPESATFYMSQGSVAHQQGDADTAKAMFEKAIELNPNLDQAQNTLGYLYLLDGDLERAESALKMALKVDPDMVGALVNMGNVLLEQGRVADATRHFQQALETDSNQPVIHICLGRAFMQQGAPGLAEQCFRNAMELDPQMEAAQLGLAEALLGSRIADEAEELIEGVLNKRPDDAEAMRLRGDVAMVRRDALGAVESYMRALQLDANDEQALEQLARAYRMAGQLDQAERTFRARIQKGTASIEVVLEYAELQEQMGEPSAALQTLNLALKSLPDHGPTIAALARLNAKRTDIESGLATLREHAKGRDANLQLLRAHLLYAKGEMEQVRTALVDIDAMTLEVEQQDALDLLRALVSVVDGDGEQALSVWRRQRFNRLIGDFRWPTASTEEVESWPRVSIEDDRPEPVFLTGFPGARVEQLAAALRSNPQLAVLTDRLSQPGERNDILTPQASARKLTDLDEGRIRLLRRRYDHGRRRWTPMPTEPRATIDVLPWAPMSWYTIYRAFPEARVLVLTRDLRDHLVHALKNGFDGAGDGKDDQRIIAQLDAAWGEYEVAREALPLSIELIDESALGSVIEADHPIAEAINWSGSLSLGENWRDDAAPGELSDFLPDGSWQAFEKPLAEAFDGLSKRAGGSN
ncbi:MAG: hypothetical protein DHS20C11_09660 [Lysobacteraceae bacterium]|nr:MAG: hypothetical protein DHS20C11_09660 [Xanthomonadaceae bacterium]